jgi:hypothetical protein
MWVTTLWASRRQIAAVAGICSASTVVGFWLSPASSEVNWITAGNVFLNVFSIFGVAQISLRRSAAEEARIAAAKELELSREEIKVLAGMLPICASCKKIRNEEGSWEDLEKYISEHSEAEFSHGICQACMTRLYPEIALPPD